MRLYTIISIIIISVLSMNQASAVTFSPNDIEWDSAVTGTLHNGQTLTNGESSTVPCGRARCKRH